MAKKCQIERNKKRIRMAEKQSALRDQLKKQIKDESLSDDERQKARSRLSKLPRNGAKVRVVNRCNVTGRSHGVYKKFGISRIVFREMALEGKLPGVTKASW